MNSLDFFLLQMNDKDSQIAARSLEMNFRCLEGSEGLNNALKHINQNHPSRLQHEWVGPLIDAIRPYYVPVDADDIDVDDDLMFDEFDDADYTNPLTQFLEAMLEKLNGGRSFFVTKNFNLDNFTKEELAQPHMQWLTIFTNRFNELKERGHTKNAFRLARIHPYHNISDELALTLAEMFEEDDWFLGMEFSQFVDYYVKSREHFTVENETLKPELAERMKKTLHAWEENKDLDHLYWLSRNYEFHPLHKPFLSKFIEETIGSGK